MAAIPDVLRLNRARLSERDVQTNDGQVVLRQYPGRAVLGIRGLVTPPSRRLSAREVQPFAGL
jgi:hypothetical protein